MTPSTREQRLPFADQTLAMRKCAGAWARGITRKLPKLVRSTDYFPLLIVQVGSDETVQRSLQTMKRDFGGLGHLVQGTGAQVIMCSIPSGAMRDMEQAWKAQVMNKWLRGWC